MDLRLANPHSHQGIPYTKPVCVYYEPTSYWFYFSGKPWYKNIHPVNIDFRFLMHLQQVLLYYYFYIYKHQSEGSSP